MEIQFTTQWTIRKMKMPNFSGLWANVTPPDSTFRRRPRSLHERPSLGQVCAPGWKQASSKSRTGNRIDMNRRSGCACVTFSSVQVASMVKYGVDNRPRFIHFIEMCHQLRLNKVRLTSLAGKRMLGRKFLQLFRSHQQDGLLLVPARVAKRQGPGCSARRVVGKQRNTLNTPLSSLVSQECS